MRISSEVFPLSDNPASFDIHGLDQFNGLWAIESSRFRNLMTMVAATDLAGHINANSNLRLRSFSDEGLEVVDGRVAVIRLSGAMSKRGSSFNFNGSTLRVRQEFLSAERNENIESILFHVESPGGTTAGTKELGDVIARVAEKKRVVTFAEDIAASAAYWVGSQASQFFANAPALVGSIGTYLTIADYSEYAKNEGIKVHVVKAGDGKGVATPGTEITDDQLADLQKIVNETNDFFVEAIAQGRGFTDSKAREMNNGKVYLAEEAVALGLIDGVSTFDDVLISLLNGSDERDTMRNLLRGEAIESDNVETDAASNEVTTETEATEAPVENAETSGDTIVSVTESASESPLAIDILAKPESTDTKSLIALSALFGPQDGAAYFASGLSVKQAIEKRDAQSAEKVEALETKVVDLESQNKALRQSELGRMAGQSTDSPESGQGFASVLRLNGIGASKN